MNREQVLDVVKKYIDDSIEDIDVESLQPTMSMKDYGINSLDMVEIVSRSMRELKVKVPRSDLNKLENIDGLVDLLFEAVEARAS